MQARKTIMAAALAAASSLTLAAPALGQVDLQGAASVTGTSGFQNELAGGSRMWDGQKVHGENAATTYDWQASDPRLTGELTVKYNSDFYERQGLFLASGQSTLQTDDGRWVGTAQFVGGPDIVGAMTLVLEGEGPYEGLTAYITANEDEGPITFSAGVFPGSMPQPPAPVQRTSRLGGR